MKVEEICHASSDEILGIADHLLTRITMRCAGRRLTRTRTDKDANLVPAPLTSCVSGILKGRPGHLHEHSLLRIYCSRMGFRHPEETMVKLASTLDEPTPFADARSLMGWVGMIEAMIHGPTLGGDLTDCVIAAQKLLPVLARRRCLWKTTADADDGDGFQDPAGRWHILASGTLRRTRALILVIFGGKTARLRMG